MAEIIERLVQLTRSYLSDLLEKRFSRPQTEAPWDIDSGAPRGAKRPGGASASAAETTAGAASGLPYSDELARCYATLDLPFGTPMAQVTRRWKSYLKKCHPDRHASDPRKLADATELTQILTGAHDRIKAAWERYQA